MRNLRSMALIAALAASATFAGIGHAPAAPVSPGAAKAIAVLADEGTLVEQIQVRRRPPRISGGAVAGGFLGGLLLGGLIASQPPVYYYPYYPAYPVPRVYVPATDAIAYCMRRFKSYDPYSMTYLGYDGLRHPCP